MSSTRLILVTCALLWTIFTYGTENWVKSTHGHRVGNRRRIVAVLRIECLLTALNVLCYHWLMSWFDESTTAKKHARMKNKRRCSLLLLIFLFLGQAMYFMYYAPTWMQYLLFDLTSICAGIWTNLIAFVCGFALVNLLIRTMMAFSPTRWVIETVTKIDVFHKLVWNRKYQIKFTLVVTIIMSLLMYISRDIIVIKEKVIEVNNLKTPLKLAVVSDLHAGASVYKCQIENVVDKVLEMDVDALLIVGDVVDGSVNDLEDRVTPLFTLSQRLPTFFVTGNHEYYYGDVLEWMDFYRKNKINVLDNRAQVFQNICIVGVNDISSNKIGIEAHSMNLTTALHDCPQNLTRILMSHNPVSVKFFDKQDLNTVDLVISGHTHAGQFYVVIPLVYWLLPYFYGHYHLTPMTQLFISAGSLYQGPPMKMVGMSEVWKITLIGK